MPACPDRQHTHDARFRNAINQRGRRAAKVHHVHRSPLRRDLATSPGDRGLTFDEFRTHLLHPIAAAERDLDYKWRKAAAPRLALAVIVRDPVARVLSEYRYWGRQCEPKSSGPCSVTCAGSDHR